MEVYSSLDWGAGSAWTLGIAGAVAVIMCGYLVCGGWGLSEAQKRSLRGKHVLVTGGANGIGKEICLQLAELGAVVICWDKDQERLLNMGKEMKQQGHSFYGYDVDLCRKEDICACARKVREEVGDVNVVVNNAGIVSATPFLDLTDEQMERSFKVNAMAQMRITKEFLPAMVTKKEGFLVNVASVLGHFGAHRCTDYCASKFAVVGFHESLEMELGEYRNIGMLLVCPATVSTDMFAGVKQYIYPSMSPKWVAEQILYRILCRRSGILYLPPIMDLAVLVMKALPFRVRYWIALLTRTDKSLVKVKGTNAS
eukprot:Nk52_evm82s224 gene=Nk52_evmTU82s224